MGHVSCIGAPAPIRRGAGTSDREGKRKRARASDAGRSDLVFPITPREGLRLVGADGSDHRGRMTYDLRRPLAS